MSAGRPGVGPKVEVRLDVNTLAAVEASAAAAGMTRAAWLRAAIAAAATPQPEPVLTAGYCGVDELDLGDEVIDDDGHVWTVRQTQEAHPLEQQGACAVLERAGHREPRVVWDEDGMVSVLVR